MRVLALFCAAFAAGITAAQYLLPAVWALRLGVLCALAALVLVCFGCARRRGVWAKRALLCAMGLSCALFYNAAYAHFVKAPNDALLGAQETVTVELCSYPEATAWGAKATARIVDRSLPGRVVYYGDTALLDLAPGARVTCEARFNSATDPAGKGLHLRNFTAKGVYLLLYQRGEPEYDTSHEGAARYLPQCIAHLLGETVTRHYGAREGSFLRALLLGDKSDLDEEDASNLSEVGLSHIMAVSGLHCCFLASIIGTLLGQNRRRLRCAVTVPLLFLYAFVTGMTPSILRACIMLSLGMLAPLLGRENDPPTSISFALMLILLKNPFSVASISLQLSFSAVAGIVWLTPRLVRKWRPEHRLPRTMLLSFATTLGAMVFSTPLACWYFGTLSIVSLLSNLLCLWLVSIVFALGLASVLLSAVVPQLGALLAFVPSLGIDGILWLADTLQRLPYHAVYFNTAFSFVWLGYAYALFAACALCRRGKYRYWAALGLACVGLFAAARVNALYYERSALSVVVLDVGQGESVLLISEGHAVLVDCGSSNSYIDAGDIAADYLHSAGCRGLDAVVLTHYHADHANGLAALLARTEVDSLYIPDIDAGEGERDTVEQLSARYALDVHYVTARTELSSGASTLTLYPPVGESGANELGLSILCTFDEFDVLITGDMDKKTEERLIEAYELPDIEVLVVGHHGSKNSSGAAFLQAVTPEIGIISVGDNSYGHPTEEALLRLTDEDITVYRTDMQGDILISVDRED